MCFISFIIPIYNVEKYLEQCIDSILQQSYRDFEIILIDDGSTDGSSRICDNYTKLDNRVKVFHKVNGGLSDARNTGLLHATGEYVIFLDSDDFWVDSNDLVLLVNKILRTKCDFLQFNMSYYIRGKYIHWKPFDNLLLNSSDKNMIIVQLIRSGVVPMSACSKIINRNFLLKNELFFIKGIYSEDIPWFLKLLEKAKNIVFLNQYVYAYRKGVSSSISSTFSEKKYNDLLGILEREVSSLNNSNTWESWVKDSLLSFMAYEYSQLLGFSYGLPKEKRALEWDNLKKYSFLLKYHDNPKVKYVNMFYRVFGLKLTSFCLWIFIKNK